MASSVREYLIKSAKIYGGSTNFQEKLSNLSSMYGTLSSFKSAKPKKLESFKTVEGAPLIKKLTNKELEVLKLIQKQIDKTISIEDNFIALLTSDFINRQLKMLNEMTLDRINANPLLCSALHLETEYDLIKYNVYESVTRGIVTSMGYLVENLLLFSSNDVYAGKDYEEGEKVKWDLVVQKIDSVRCYIEVKSGPNDLDAGQIQLYKDEIEAVEKIDYKGYIGMTYGKRESNTVSLGIFKKEKEYWDSRTLIGTELWDFVTGDDRYHIELMEMIKKTADTLLSRKSIINIIEKKIKSLTKDFKDKYGDIDTYLNQLW